jgi:hypothetical protein
VSKALDWSRAAIDGSHIDAKKGGAGTGPSPVNRGKPGSEHHLICDGNGTPIYVLTSGANVPDISRAIDLLDGAPAIAGRPGRPRRRFVTLLADKGYDSEAFRQACRQRGTEPIMTFGLSALLPRTPTSEPAAPRPGFQNEDSDQEDGGGRGQECGRLPPALRVVDAEDLTGDVAGANGVADLGTRL